jgi:steroid Delta-isomerase
MSTKSNKDMPRQSVESANFTQGVVDFFEHLTPASVADMATVYATNAYFKDPFNAVTGLTEIQAIFEHMFASLDAPRFVVTEQITPARPGESCFLVWDFHFRLRGKPAEFTIHGSSHLRFAEDGRVTYHRDYWDAAEELYEKLPVVGSVMRWLKRRARS